MYGPGPEIEGLRGEATLSYTLPTQCFYPLSHEKTLKFPRVMISIRLVLCRACVLSPGAWAQGVKEKTGL